MENDLHLALWQTAYAPSPAEALKRLDAAARSARTQGADLLVCPEMSLTGYAIGPGRVAALAEPRDGALAQAVADIARRHALAIAYGYPERHPQGGRPFNAVQAIGPEGQALGHYRKTHLYGALDAAQFSPGETASQVWEWRGWRLGLLICFDVEFPEAVRLLALQGADAVLVPTANMAEFPEVPMLLLPARACENRLYLAYANACGNEPGLTYGGLSTVTGPSGTVLARADEHDALLLARLNPGLLAQARRSSPLAFRRSDLYAPLLAPPEPG
jgi:predicted amidohydrolase